MSKLSTKPASGMRDFLPEDVARRRYVTRIIEEIFQGFGFVPLETPAIENLTTLLGKYGSEGDQLLFRLLHRRDALARALEKKPVAEADLSDLGLRYDLTVPFARVVAEHRTLPRFFKRYQIQPVWRADRPARGRFREFFQCDVDVIGTKSLIAEAEVISAVCAVLKKLGFADFTVHLNHRAVLRSLIRTAGIALSEEQTALVALDKFDKIGRDAVLTEMEQRNIPRASAEKLLTTLATLQGKKPVEMTEALRKNLDDEGKQAADELSQLIALCAQTDAGAHLALTPELARGLGYYTGPIFEISVADLAGSLGGGGRYDNLIGMFSGQEIPAVGFSLGLERILLVMEERKMYPALRTGADVMLCGIDVKPEQLLRVAHELRHQGLRVEVYPEPAKIGKQLQYADSDGVKAPVAAILGATELAENKLVLKHLASGKQVTVPIADAKSAINTLAN